MEDKSIAEPDNIFECQKLYASRLYEKIDYHKRVRLHIPVFSAVASFAFLSTSIKYGFPSSESVIFILISFSIGVISSITLEVVRRSFNRNVNQLEYLYKEMGIGGEKFGKNDDSLVERSRHMWLLLQFLILVSWFVPSLLVLFAKSTP
ncbi:MAG: hypothetical protein AAF495_03925 [Pseudomonadota bacterium]